MDMEDLQCAGEYWELQSRYRRVEESLETMSTAELMRFNRTVRNLLKEINLTELQRRYPEAYGMSSGEASSNVLLRSFHLFNALSDVLTGGGDPLYIDHRELLVQAYVVLDRITTLRPDLRTSLRLTH